MVKFNDLHSNYGLPEGVSPEQIVNGAIINVVWEDSIVDNCIIVDASEFQEDYVDSSDLLHNIKILCISDFSEERITQDQIVKLVATHDTVRDALKVWSNPDVE